MKKSILVVSDSLNMGGLEKCLINLCDNFDYDKYEVDLYLFNAGRTLLEKLNKNVNLLPDSPYYTDLYNMSVFSSIKTLIKKKKWGLALYRFIRFLRIRFKDYKYRNFDWFVMQKTMLKLDKKYDIAVGFAEGTACYYVAECVSADVKIGWIHTDLKQVKHNRKLDQRAFEKLDRVATVSQNSLNSLKELHPSCIDKFSCIMLTGLMNFEEFEALANRPNEIDKKTVNILSVGRLVELKGFHLCIPACKKLVDDGYNTKWYIAGEGPQREELEELIKQNNLQEHFILLGNKENPYTYIKSADICVQPSSYEGLSLVVYEEKYFKKPVIATGILGNLEMIKDHQNGLIIERNSDSIYKAVKELLDDKKLLEKLGQTPALNYVTKEKTMKEIEKLFIAK